MLITIKFDIIGLIIIIKFRGIIFTIKFKVYNIIESRSAANLLNASTNKL